MIMGKLSRTQTVLFIIFFSYCLGSELAVIQICVVVHTAGIVLGTQTLLAGLVLLLIALPRYKKLHFKETWPVYLLSALFNVVLYYGLQTIGLNYLPAGLFSALVFLQPVLVGLFSWMWLGEAMYGLKMAGLVLGFSGVGLISTGGISGHISFTGIMFALGSALSWAIGTVYVKKKSFGRGPDLAGDAPIHHRRALHDGCGLKCRALDRYCLDTCFYSDASVYFAFCHRDRLARIL